MKIETKTFTIYTPERGKTSGRFENNVHGYYGALDFCGTTLIGYDGIYSLPTEIADALQANGYALRKDIA
jgi:hypothetical protein